MLHIDEQNLQLCTIRVGLVMHWQYIIKQGVGIV